MNKFKLSLIYLSCSIFLAACSSSSGGGSDNSEQIRQTETTLTKRLAELSQQVKAAQTQAQQAQAKYDEARKLSNASETQAAKLALEVANLKKAQAELALAQAEQSKASAQDIEKLKADLEKANQAVNDANKTIEKAAEESKKKEEAAQKRIEDFERYKNLQDAEKARIPISPIAFGSISGLMTDEISGINLSLKDGKEVISIPTLTTYYKAIVVADEHGAREQNLSTADSDFYTYLGKSGNQILNTYLFDRDVSFGVYYSDPYNTQESAKLIYVQGKPTDMSQIPSENVKYRGGLAYIKDGQRDDYVTDEGLTANADFANKTISIDVEKKETTRNGLEIPEMHFGGKITNNSFAGNVNNIKTQGGFFGENARILSGVFTNDADKSRGVFGAIKQDAAQ